MSSILRIVQQQQQMPIDEDKLRGIILDWTEKIF